MLESKTEKAAGNQRKTKQKLFFCMPRRHIEEEEV
jgi:hypothetical protein